ncbi:MAG TPA: LptE family protein [Methylomirabilota bacterium]|nr:LptE family protein [Methylomirabilota bacterium]
MRRAAALLVALGLAAAGCGYALSGNLPDHIRTVHVPVFKNRTQAPGVESAVTTGVITAFGNGGRLKVVPLEEADSVLDGEIVSYSFQPLSYDQQSNVREYRVVIVVNVKFRDVRRSELLWAQQGLSEKSDFRVLGQVSDTLSREDFSVRQAATDIGRKIAALAIDRF